MGPYSAERVYNNGTIRIRSGAVSERVNIPSWGTPYLKNDGNWEAFELHALYEHQQDFAVYKIQIVSS